MKIYIALVCMLLSAGVATAQTAKDFDLTCAVTAGAEIASNPKGSAEREAAMMVWTFYLGRLSGREDKTSWGPVIKERMAEMREKARSKELHGKCTDFYTATMTE